MRLFKWLQIKVMGVDIWPVIKWFKRRKGFKTGKLAAKHDPKNRTLKMAKYMANLPDPPEEFCNIEIAKKKTGISDITLLYPLDGNDQYGNCVVAGTAHHLTTLFARLGLTFIPTRKQVIKTYKDRVGCKDTGLVMLTWLKWCRKNGVFGEDIIAFGRVDPKNHKQVKQSIQLFGGVLAGFEVQASCMEDFLNRIMWQPGPSTGSGHCVDGSSYKPDRIVTLTWGRDQDGSWEWWDAHTDECFVLLTKEVFKPGFAEGFDSETLKADFELITGEILSITN